MIIGLDSLVKIKIFLGKKYLNFKLNLDFKPVDNFVWSPNNEKVENYTNWLSNQPLVIQDRDNCGIICK